MKPGRLVLLIVFFLIIGCVPNNNKFGSVSVKSNPTGADVYLDGLLTGKKTDCVLESLTVNEHVIKLSLPKYEDFYDTVAVIADDTIEVFAELTPLPRYGAIQVNSTPSGATIYLDEVNTNHLTNYLLTNIPVGSHTIKLLKSDYLDWQDTVVVVEDDTVELSATLIQKKGAIRVSSKPVGASVWLDAINTYKTTNCVLTNVSVGSHSVKLTKTDYENFETTITVVQDETTDVSTTLVRAYQIFGSCNTPGSAYDVEVSGNYAYVADGDSGLSVIDFSDRSHPTITGSCPVSGKATGLALSGFYVYVAVANGKLAVVNVATPTHPSVVAFCPLSGSPSAVFVSGDYAYVASGSSGLHIVNIANPSSPQLASSYQTGGPALAVFVTGNFAYVAAGSAGLEIVDISLPWNPRLVSRDDTPGEACGIFFSGSYTFIADGPAGLQIMAGAKTGTYDTPNYAAGVYGMGSYAYVADRSAGLLIVDASEPSTPELVGRCDTPGQAQAIWVSGSYIYIADGDAGLEIIKM